MSKCYGKYGFGTLVQHRIVTNLQSVKKIQCLQSAIKQGMPVDECVL